MKPITIYWRSPRSFTTVGWRSCLPSHRPCAQSSESLDHSWGARSPIPVRLGRTRRPEEKTFYRYQSEWQTTRYVPQHSDFQSAWSVLILEFGLPAIIDPNNDITLFKSGAIVSYLIATYDKSSTLTYTSFPEIFRLQQWAFFQASGQGPYFGQAAW